MKGYKVWGLVIQRRDSGGIYVRDVGSNHTGGGGGGINEMWGIIIQGRGGGGRYEGGI